MEVICTGLHQTPEQIVETVLEEDADAIGPSSPSGAHMTLVPRIVALIREPGVLDVIVTVGGTIAKPDIPELERLGVAAVLTPGSRSSGHQRLSAAKRRRANAGVRRRGVLPSKAASVEAPRAR